MGLLSRIFGPKGGGGLPVAELARRLGTTEAALRAIPVRYRRFGIPKRSGGTRMLLAPDGALKDIQRRILRKLLKRLKAHPAVHGFERGRSIVTNARSHAGAAIVVRLDIQEFFTSTSERRVADYFKTLGWDRQAIDLLQKLCTHDGALPQGAPTSPRLANLVNWELDARLSGLAESMGAVYTRYADDLTFSLDDQGAGREHSLVGMAAFIVRECGYQLHRKKKLTIRRAHQSQRVTGLVVNQQVALPRQTRRRLRAIDHYARCGKTPTLTPTQREGWAALEHMVETQREE